MTTENKFLLAPKSHGLYLNDALVHGAGTVDLGEEGDADSELVDDREDRWGGRGTQH